MPNNAASTPAAGSHVQAAVTPGATTVGADTPGGGALEGPGAADQGLVDALVQLSFLVQGVLGKVTAEHGISVIQLRLLGILRDREPGMQELARHLELDKSSMTGLVTRAERRGMVRRGTSPHDRRAVVVSLTEEGRALVRQGAAEAARRIDALAAELSAAQREQLSRLAGAIIGPATTI